MAKWSGWDWISYGCLGFAALGLAAGAWGKENPEMFSNLPSVFSSSKWAAAPAILFVLATIIFIFRLFGADPHTKAVNSLPPQFLSAAKLIKEPAIDWDDSGRISLRGRFTRSDGPVSIYVTYGSAGNSPAFPRTRSVVSGNLSVQPRIKIGSIAHFDSDENADITIGTTSGVEGNQHVIQWGEPEQKNVKVGITWANYFCFVVLVWRDGKEEFYPLIFASKSLTSTDGKSTVPELPTIFGSDVMLAYMGMKNTKR